MANFEERLAALETVVDRLERGELSLEESVRLFEEGAKLSSSCKAELEAAEGRIQVLIEPNKGSVVTNDLIVDDEDGDGEFFNKDDGGEE